MLIYSSDSFLILKKVQKNKIIKILNDYLLNYERFNFDEDLHDNVTLRRVAAIQRNKSIFVVQLCRLTLFHLT